MEYALVTVMISELNQECDMELPTGIKLGELVPSMFETLTHYMSGIIKGKGGGRLFSDGKALDPDLTLSDYDIWDGSIIEMRLS